MAFKLPAGLSDWTTDWTTEGLGPPTQRHDSHNEKHLRDSTEPNEASPVAHSSATVSTSSASGSETLSSTQSSASTASISASSTPAATQSSSATEQPSLSVSVTSAATASSTIQPPSPSALARGGCEIRFGQPPDARSFDVHVTHPAGAAASAFCASLLMTFASSAEASKGVRFTAGFEPLLAGAPSCAAAVYFPDGAPAGTYTLTLSGTPDAASCALAQGSQRALELGAPPPPNNDVSAAVRRLTAGPIEGSAIAAALANDAPLVIPAAGASPARFALNAAAFGRPAPQAVDAGVRDLWRVDISGTVEGQEVRAGATVDIAVDAWSPPGAPGTGAPLYTFELTLPPVPGAAYRLELFLQQTAFNTAGFRSETCRESRDPASMVLNTTLRLVRGVVATRAPSGSGAIVPPQAPPSLFRGWYSRNATRNESATPVERFAWHAGGGSGGSAPFRYFTPPEARQCLAGKWLAFVGDSTMEELAISTLLLTGASYDEGWSDAYCAKLGFKTARIFDTGRGTAPAPELAAGGTRITMYWAAATEACADLRGTYAFTSEPFLAGLRAAHVPDNGGARKPIVLFNTGLHDLARSLPPINVGDFQGHVSGVIADTLRGFIGETLILKSSNPKTGEYACKGHGAQTNVGEAAVQAVNRLSQEALRASNLTFSVLDEHALLLPFSEPTELRQHHCTDILIRPPRSLERVYSGCLATAQALLNMLCPADGAVPAAAAAV